MIVLVTVDSMPHPDPNHLGSRVRNIGRLIGAYDNKLTFTTDPEKSDELISEVKAYCISRHTEVLDVKTYFDLEIFSGRIL